MINYSFIIPHKNTPDLLQKCLDSIPRRDDVQIIVVDDNSDEGKVDFEHFPGLDDPSVEIYLTKEGKGAGYARNVGLKHAVGKWLAFADADDFFNPCIEEALETYKSSEADIVFFKGNCIVLSTGEAGHRGEIMNEAVDKAISTNDFSDVLLLTSPCKRFVKKKLVDRHDIHFDEVRWANDVTFTASTAIYAHKLEASGLPIYCITESSGSLVYCKSLESQVVRFKEEGKGVRIYRKRFPASRLVYWYFFTWMSVYKISKKKALLLFPQAVWNCGLKFLTFAIKAKLS